MRAGFLPWHRAYLLDLERELQAIDPGVALPYWRFDRPAANLFQLDFLGVADSLGTVRFSSSSPLQFWRTDGVQGINRRPLFNTGSAPPRLRSEAADPGARHASYRLFRTMEEIPMARRIPASAARSRASAPRRRIRCSSCSTAMSIACGRSGSSRTAASIRRWPPPTTAQRTRSVTISRTRCGRGTG